MDINIHPVRYPFLERNAIVNKILLFIYYVNGDEMFFIVTQPNVHRCKHIIIINITSNTLINNTHVYDCLFSPNIFSQLSDWMTQINVENRYS